MSVTAIRELPQVDELGFPVDLARAYVETQDFVSLLAHELRTQLKLTELALDRADDEALEAAKANTHTIQELVEDLLELARGDRGGTSDANVALANVIDGLHLSADRAEIVAGKLPVVRLPLRLTETILRNLVVNALEAGATRIEILARPDGTITVSDNGCGVSPLNASRIFTVYSGKFGGAGLGLTLCREILRRRGGDIWLELPSTFAFRVG